MAKKRQDNDLGDWGLIIFLFVLGVWPVALFLMFTKLFGASENKRQTAPPLNQTTQSVKREAPSQRKTAVTSKKIMRSPAAKRSTAKWLQIAGVILLALGALATVDPIQIMLHYPEIAWWQTELLEDLAILVAGGALLGSGFSMDRSLKRFARYLADNKITLPRRTYVHITVYEEVGHGGSGSVPAGVTEAIAVDMGCVGDGLQCTERQVSICAKDSGGPYSYEVVGGLIEAAKETGADYAVDVYPYYGSDVEATLRAGFDIRHGLIGPGVYASHGYERSHIDGVYNTLKLLAGYTAKKVAL